MEFLDQLISFPAAVLDSDQGLRVLFLAAVGLAGVMLAVWMSLAIQRQRDPLRRRLERASAAAEDRGPIANAQRIAARLGKELVPKDAKKRSETAVKLLHAGYRSSAATPVYYGIRVLAMAVIAPVATLAFLSETDGNMGESLQYGVALGLLGFLAPGWLLSRKVALRQKRVRRGLPDALDMMVVCSEAGLGMNASIDRVGREIEIQHPELAKELVTITREMRAGLDTGTAMRGLFDRTGVDEVRSLVSTMLQAMRFGTGVAKSLRVYSDDLRDKRLQTAEETAAKLEVKMILPIALLIMPAFLLIAIGPSVIQLSKGFKGGF